MINGMLIIILTHIDYYCYYNNGSEASEMLFVGILDYKLEDIKTHWIKDD